ncbi:MAG: 50S ribosomal protein L4 [Candidatus Peribacteraceae bacterium]|nr:50S ribosomal protein L4 [Candidatus Peribacteraceae bacterium]
MTIDLYTATGSKTGTLELPKELFEARINRGLIHQAVIMQQSNRRQPIARAKSRGEVVGSTHKIYAQKHTGRARHGAVRSPTMRGGGKAFGPKNDRNFSKDMPKAMRHAALAACLSLQAKEGKIVGLESYPETIKTKAFHALLQKLPVDIGRRIVIVLPENHKGLTLSCRNVPNVKTLLASYLNPEDVMGARHLIFLNGSIEKAMSVFAKQPSKIKVKDTVEVAVKKPTLRSKTAKKTTAATTVKTAKKAPSKKSSSSKK